jgi:hypothetical protein
MRNQEDMKPLIGFGKTPRIFFAFQVIVKIISVSAWSYKRFEMKNRISCICHLVAWQALGFGE